jgi:hypothetical protein
MGAVLDSSTLISLARAGLLQMLQVLPLDLEVLDVVRNEAVDAGLAAFHPDASAIETALTRFPTTRTRGKGSVDEIVVRAARSSGTLVTNDRALGRRARNLGARWLRTADLVALCVRGGKMTVGEGRAAIGALLRAGRLDERLAQEYLGELR